MSITINISGNTSIDEQNLDNFKLSKITFEVFGSNIKLDKISSFITENQFDTIIFNFSLLSENFPQFIDNWLSNVRSRKVELTEYIKKPGYMDKFIQTLNTNPNIETIIINSDVSSSLHYVTKKIEFKPMIYNMDSCFNVAKAPYLTFISITGKNMIEFPDRFFDILSKRIHLKHLDISCSKSFISNIEKIIYMPNLKCLFIRDKNINMMKYGNKFIRAIQNTKCKIEGFGFYLRTLNKIQSSFNIFVTNVFILDYKNIILPDHSHLLIDKNDLSNRLIYNQKQKINRQSSLVERCCFYLKSQGIKYQDLISIVPNDHILKRLLS